MVKRLWFVLFAFFIVSLVFKLYVFFYPEEFFCVSKPYSWYHDFYGRNIFIMSFVGLFDSLLIGIFSRFLAIFLAVLVSMFMHLNAFFRFIFDYITEILLVIPSILLAILLVFVIGFGKWSVFFIIVLSTWAYPSRYLYNIIYGVKEKDFVLASLSLGKGRFSIFFSDIFKFILPHIGILFFTGISINIMAEATLSFLGFGSSGNAYEIPSIGEYINYGFSYLTQNPFIVIIPSVLLSGMVLLLNTIGDKMRSYL